MGFSSSFGWASDHGEPRSAWWSAGILCFVVSVCLAGVMGSVCCWLALARPSRSLPVFFLVFLRSGCSSVFFRFNPCGFFRFNPCGFFLYNIICVMAAIVICFVYTVLTVGLTLHACCSYVYHVLIECSCTCVSFFALLGAPYLEQQRTGQAVQACHTVVRQAHNYPTTKGPTVSFL